MTQQTRFGSPDVPECEAEDCETPAEWVLRCTARDYDGTVVRCDEHTDTPEPFVGAWAAALSFEKERLTVEAD